VHCPAASATLRNLRYNFGVAVKRELPVSERPVSQELSTLPWDSPEFYPEAHAIAAKRLAFIEHKGKRILTINSVGADLPLVKAIAAECWHIVSSQEPKSVRTLNDLEGGEFTTETVKILSELAAKNRPYVVRAAVIGIKGMRFFAFQTVVSLTKRPLKLFSDRWQALDWLVQDDGPDNPARAQKPPVRMNR
jgi:hypothetical protein